MTTQAPGQYLGYSLQATRFLVRLLEADADWTVSLEVFEDVGVEDPQGNRIAEQTKSSLEGNPVSDHSLGLWKTFSSWVSAVQCGELVPERTLFEIYVSSPKSGNIAESFSQAQSPTQALSMLRNVKAELWGATPEFRLRDEVSESIRPYVTRVFTASEDVVCRIIENFQLRSGSGSPQADLKALFGRLLVTDDIIDDLLKHAQGWVKETTDRLLELGKPASVTVEAFRNEVISYARRRDNRTILCTFASDPTSEDIEKDMQIRTYVRQLDIVDVQDGDKIAAVTDYLKASVDRTQWSDRGLVHSASFKDFEAGLCRTWGNCRNRTNLAHQALSDIERGKLLYYECASHRATLEGLEVPDHFTPGSFHALADGLDIGWHPHYTDLLKAGTQ